jgi:Ca2+-binding EF-hand superfamily protein
MYKRTSAALAGLVALIAAQAHAGETQQGEAVRDTITPAFTQIDVDQDGSITISEAEGTWLAEAFTLVDANQDGAIDEKEYLEAMS